MARKLSVLLFLCFAVGLVGAADSDSIDLVVVDATPDGGSPTAVITVEIRADGLQGWSWGVCHDPAEASIGECAGLSLDKPCEDADCPAVTCPPSMVEPVEGEEADFNTVNIFDEGVAQGVVLSFTQGYTIGVDQSPFEMLQVVYTPADGHEGCITVTPCGTLGTPATEVTFVYEGQSFPPTVQTGTCVGGGPQPDCTELKVHLADAGDGKVAVHLDTSPDEDAGVSGFQFGLADDQADVRVESDDAVMEGAAITAAGGADFWGVNIVDGGVTLGVVIDLEPDGDVWRTLPGATCDQEIAVVQFCKEPGSAVTSAAVTLTETLGDPPVEIVVDVDGESKDPTIDATAVTITNIPDCGGGPVEADFIRGDTNQDGRHTVSDAVAIAKAIVGQGSKLPLIQACEDSADTNDDGTLDLQDAVFLLEYMFTGGSALPAPMNSCGQDPTADDLHCSEFTCP